MTRDKRKAKVGQFAKTVSQLMFKPVMCNGYSVLPVSISADVSSLSMSPCSLSECL